MLAGQTVHVTKNNTRVYSSLNFCKTCSDIMLYAYARYNQNIRTMQTLCLGKTLLHRPYIMIILFGFSIGCSPFSRSVLIHRITLEKVNNQRAIDSRHRLYSKQRGSVLEICVSGALAGYPASLAPPPPPPPSSHPSLPPSDTF